MNSSIDASDLISERVGVTFEESAITLPSDKAATECLAETAEILLERGYITKADLPVKSGFKRYLLNTEETHQDGEDMIRPKEVGDGMFLETNYNKEEIKRKIEMLLELASA